MADTKYVDMDATDQEVQVYRAEMLRVANDMSLMSLPRQAAVILANYYGAVLDGRMIKKAEGHG